ncbi:MAG: shikimate dehydrogenase [Polyangiaceae bacterium]|nr:shikimate dehydrogenase [Polyangiaceae bacterium]
MSPLRFAVIGSPVARSASPAMHRAAYAALGLPHGYEAAECRDEHAVKAAVGLLRNGTLAGINVTAPWKRAVLAHADSLDASTAAVGAANTLAREGDRVVAHNTDVPALVSEISRLDPALRGTAAILGSGGAAAAALAACRQLGVRVVAMTTRSFSSSEALHESETAESLRRAGALTVLWPTDAPPETSNASMALRLQWDDLVAGADILVQATSARDDGPARAVPWSRVKPGAVALELGYGPKETPFLAAARARGLRADDGVGMLVRQGAIAFERWLGVAPDLDVMRDAVLRHLARG